MIYDTFIKRPRLAMVVSIILVMIGIIAINFIPVSQYPDISPTTIRVSTYYTGADAESIEESVAQLIDDAVTGVDGMKYMSSNSASDGSYSLTIVFTTGIDSDIAAINVQNRINAVLPSLPPEVRAAGVAVTKATNDMLQVFAVYSPDNSRDSLFLSNYITINILSELKRISGVGNAFLFDSHNYAMRIWLQPEKINSLKITVNDVIRAIQAQNVQAAAGKIGAPPVGSDQQMEFNIVTKGKLSSVRDFANIVLKANEDGAFIRLKDVARIEIESRSFASESSLDGGSSSAMAIYMSSGANAVNVAEAVSNKLAELSENFPTGVAYKTMYNTADFVSSMLSKVMETLLEAFVMVAIVIFVFLGRFRPTIIPLITVPIAIIGAVAVMYVLGFTANSVSLLALVLAIGIVVDDAIIVVENVERIMEEEPQLSATAVTSKAMKEIAGPIIAITLVLLSVFVPVAFMPGASGALLREFSVTISAAMVISAINALTLSPALCSILLRHGKKIPIMKQVSAVIGKTGYGYAKLARFLSKFAIASIAVILLFAALSYFIFNQIPAGFVPSEDKGFVIVAANLPAGASLNRTKEALIKADAIIRKNPAVDDIVLISGFDLFGGASSSNAGVIFVKLKSFAQRATPESSVQAIVGYIYGSLSIIPDALFIPFVPPEISGGGAVGGIEYVLQAVQGQETTEIAAVANKLTAAVASNKAITGFFTTFNVDTPRIKLAIDRSKAQTLGISISDIFSSLQSLLGGYHVNNFNLYGRTWQVIIQAEQLFRTEVKDIGAIQIRSKSGQMVPVSSLATLTIEPGPKAISRYNNYRSVTFNGNPAQGVGTGEAMAQLARVSEQVLPQGYSYAWSGQALQTMEASGNTSIIIAFAFLFAYFFLVALYESWNVPIAVLISVIVAVFGAVLTIWVVGLDFGLYSQIGVIILIAMAAKNAILINSFALERRNAGMSIKESAIEGARLRFRPVMMTSIAFIMGIIPLVAASGPGAGSMVSVGFPVLGGMVFAATIGIIVIPMLYEVFQLAREKTGWRPLVTGTTPVQSDRVGDNSKLAGQKKPNEQTKQNRPF